MTFLVFELRTGWTNEVTKSMMRAGNIQKREKFMEVPTVLQYARANKRCQKIRRHMEGGLIFHVALADSEYKCLIVLRYLRHRSPTMKP